MAKQKQNKKKSKSKKPTKTLDQIQKSREKRQKRKANIQAAKDIHRGEVARWYAEGKRHTKPCHLCRGEHWAFDCAKYGEWNKSMIEKGMASKTYVPVLGPDA